MLGAYEPSFDESDWLPRIATIGVRTQANFEKANQRSALVFGNQGHNGELRLSEVGLAGFQLREVFLPGGIRPEQGSHNRELGTVNGFGLPDPGQRRLLHPRRGEHGESCRRKPEPVGAFAEVKLVEPL
jgi:hypothetical protein